MRQSPRFVVEHPEIEWSRLRGTRNIVAHEYARVDHELLWNALSREVPAITGYLRSALRD
jgi:uncharacterized protein with HEPN domain